LRSITKIDDEWLLPVIQKMVSERPTYGYRRVTALLGKHLKDLGLPPVNHKRVYRIMKRNGMVFPKIPKRPSRTHDGKIITMKSNMRWCTDCFGLRCYNGDLIQVSFVLDCHDREIIAWLASSKGITGEMIRDLMTEALEARSSSFSSSQTRIQWLSDNGPCYTARETIEFGRSLGFEICTTAPYSPESNGMAESFVKTFKRDYAYVNDLRSAEEVLGKLSEWFNDYNENAPHKGLRMMSPREYRRTISAD
jgi:transposase InsO family protein